ncbi:rheacalcin-1-like [Alligator mississippiensis]|uniref:rheacalcin-1-like n=1 Tax=Alligator mississippiensis TaxID=8496 RepID=UPI0028780DF8|nr:rheacalcin-1-like [Alligator mississippiensis]
MLSQLEDGGTGAVDPVLNFINGSPFREVAAKDQCQSFGAKSHLASIHNPEEQRVIANLIARAHGYDDEVWIGLHIAGRSDNWAWVDGSPTVHEAWHKYRRRYSWKGENCAALEDDAGYMTWDKDSCYDRNAFVCKLTL